MRNSQRHLTRRQFLLTAGASATALLGACAHPQPGPLPTAQPHTVYLPGVRRDTVLTPIASQTAVPTPQLASSPEPTPRPRRTFPVFDRPTKLGIAVQRFRIRQIMDRIIADGHPRVVKIWDDLGAAAEIKQRSPNTIVIGHIHQDYDFQHAVASGATDMAAYAADFVARHLNQYQANVGVDYWEGHNEPVFEVDWKMEFYGQFEAERVRQMAAHGLKCAVGNFAAGNPPFEQWQAFLPALQAVKQYGGALALHEYSAPTLNYGYDYALGEGTLTCRYRMVYRHYVPLELHVPIVITEAGIDGLVSSERVGAGWQDYTDYWNKIHLDPDVFWAYMDQLQWYDEELQKDDFVIGATIFVAGGDGHFVSYEITGDMGELLAQYFMAHPSG